MKIHKIEEEESEQTDENKTCINRAQKQHKLGANWALKSTTKTAQKLHKKLQVQVHLPV